MLRVMATRASRLTTAIAFPPMGTVNGLSATSSPSWSRNVPHGGRNSGGGLVFGTGPGCGAEGAEGRDDARPRLLEAEAAQGGRAAREEALADGEASVGVVNHAVAVAVATG